MIKPVGIKLLSIIVFSCAKIISLLVIVKDRSLLTFLNFNFFISMFCSSEIHMCLYVCKCLGIIVNLLEDCYKYIYQHN